MCNNSNSWRAYSWFTTSVCADDDWGAHRLTDVLPGRIATSDWNSDEGLITLSLKKDSFSLVRVSLALPEYFLDIVTSYHTRGVRFSAFGQNNHSFPGKSSPILEMPFSLIQISALVNPYEMLDFALRTLLERETDRNCHTTVRNVFLAKNATPMLPVLSRKVLPGPKLFKFTTLLQTTMRRALTVWHGREPIFVAPNLLIVCTPPLLFVDRASCTTLAPYQ